MIKFIKDNIMAILTMVMLVVLFVWSVQIISERDNTTETTQQNICDTSIKEVVESD